MMKRISLMGMAVVVAAISGHARANMIDLSGFGSDSSVPLSASIDIQFVDANSLIMTLTNTAVTAGTSNRITYFGFQLPTSGFSINVDSLSDSIWSVNQNAMLPGGGANHFNWLFKTTQVGTSAGLNIGESLILNVTADQPLFDSGFSTADWTPTSKHGYLWATKFQSVGFDGEDSGMASKLTPTTIPPPSATPPVTQSSIPEPATVALLLLGAASMFSARRSRGV